MAGCLCLPSACLYDENYLLCYDRQAINLRKTSWIWCWASCRSPLHALGDVSSEAKGTACASGYSQKKTFWWSLIQLDGILDYLFLCCYKPLAGLRFPWAHTVTVLSPAAALLCGTFATRKKSGFVHQVSDVLWYPTFSHSVPMPGDLALSPLAAVLSSAPVDCPGLLPSCE